MRTKSGGAIAQKHSHHTVRGIGYYNVEIAIVVKVSHRDAYRLVSRGSIHFGLEGAIAVAQQDADSIAGRICHCQVQVSIVVEISHCDA